MSQETLIFMAVLIGIVLWVGFSLMGWMLRSQPGVMHIVVATGGMTAMGIITFTLGQFGAPEWSRSLLLYGAFYAGLAILWQGISRFCGRTADMRLAWSGLTIFLLWIFWHAVVVVDPEAQAAGYSFSVLIWCAAGTWTLLRWGPPSLRKSTSAFALLCLTHGLYHGTLALQSAVAFLPAKLRPIWSAEGSVLEMILANIAMNLGVLFLITHRMAESLREMAHRDPLTGLLSRGRLEELGERLLRRCRERGEQAGLLIIDIDHFKEINNRYGHPAGDAALVHFAQRLRAAFSPETLVGRYGGEEFVLLLSGVALREAEAEAERLRAWLKREPALHEGIELPLTVSIGVASARGDGLAWGALLLQADGALYGAKEGGRDRVLLAEAAS